MSDTLKSKVKRLIIQATETGIVTPALEDIMKLIDDRMREVYSKTRNATLADKEFVASLELKDHIFILDPFKQECDDDNN